VLLLDVTLHGNKSFNDINLDICHTTMHVVHRDMNLRSVDLNLLVALEALLSECNVSRAAGKLGVTQSTLSHALQRLRTVFDDPLLKRGSKGMEPTERALAVRQPLKLALADIQSMLNSNAAFQPATASRAFRLSMSDAMSVEALPSIVRLLRKLSPNISLLVTTNSRRETYARIENDEIDLAIGAFPQLPRGLISKELYKDEMVCVADKKHPLLKRGRMDLKAYLASPHVTVAPNRDSGVQLDDIFTAMGVHRTVMATVPHYIAVPALIRGTDLIANTRRRLVETLRESSGLVVFPIPVKLSIPELSFRQIWHRRYDGDSGHQWFRGLVSSAVYS
jgi:DNA-binding transcriptional LysR family regulator